MYYFIVNPSSRSGRGRKVWQQVEVELERLSVEYRVFFTSGQGHAIKLSREPGWISYPGGFGRRRNGE